jgi:hypothetical protein
VILYNLLSAYKRVGLPEEFHTASIAALPEEHWKPDQNVETQPGGVGAELLTGQGGAGEFGRPSCP